MNQIIPVDAIRTSLERIWSNIEDAAIRSGRSKDQVRLVAVTKYFDSTTTRHIVQAGCRLLGESRPQQLWKKAEDLEDLDIQWHQIGHLQRNKVQRTLPLLAMLESVDSLRLLSTVDQISNELALTTQALLEVNISGDETKHGFRPQEVAEAIRTAGTLKHVQIRGLMGMASLHGGLEQARRDFAALRQLRDELLAQCPPQVELNELSMGMSRDYEVAIEEGATIVRIGSALTESH